MMHFTDANLDRSQRPLEFYYSLFYKSRLQDTIAKSNLNQYASSGIPEAEVFMMLAHLFSKTSDKVLAQHLGKTVVPWLEEHIKRLQDPREIGPAAWALGMAYSEGLTPNKEPNHESALTYFQLSAVNNHPAGMNNMGNQYRTPKVASIQVDPVEALKWFHRAAALGHASAKYNIGDCYLEGDGVEKDLVEAARWYAMAAEDGHSGAQNDLAWCYDHGYGVPQDSSKSVLWFRRAQENGDAEGIYNLAVCYEAGRGVPKDEKEALRLYRLAAEEDHGPAMVAIGLFYRNGRGGLMESQSEAIRWFRRAADLKHPEGQLQLALAYELGDGIEQNEEEAFRLYQLAAEQGSGHAQANLGNCYANGLGVTRDVNEGAKWLLKAAKGKNTEKQPIEEAQYYYAGLLRSVEMQPEIYRLLPENVEGTYIEWFTKSAELGFGEAQYVLVLHYLNMMPDETGVDEDTEFGDLEDVEFFGDDEEEDDDEDVDFEEMSIDGVDEDQKVTSTSDTKMVTDEPKNRYETSPEHMRLAMIWLRRLLHQVVEDESLAEVIMEDLFLERCMERKLDDVILAYLEAGMDMNSMIPGINLTPLEMSIRCYSQSIAKILIEHGVDINTMAKSIITPDNIGNNDAMATGQYRKNAEKLMNSGSFPLAQAAIRRQRQTETLLLNNGANVFMAKILITFATNGLQTKYLINKTGVNHSLDKRG